jgi:type I restriction enzyme, S subunit
MKNKAKFKQTETCGERTHSTEFILSEVEGLRVRRTIAEIPEAWELRELGSIGQVITGKTPPTKDADNFGDGYPFITPRDMMGQKYVRITERYVTEKGKDIVKGCLLPADSVCVSCIGSDMGKVIMTDRPSITNQQLNSLVCEQVEPHFVYYGIINIVNKLRDAAFHSTAVPILNKSAFSRFEIPIPKEKSEQRAIAKILSDLDDKIELNQQMNKTLEAIGQAIFKRWFVDCIDVQTDGWTKGKIEELMILSRDTITPNKFQNELFDHYSIPAFDERCLPKSEFGAQILSNKSIVPHNAVLLSKLNPRIPRIWFPNVSKTRRSICSTEFLVVVPESCISREYLYGLLTSRAFMDKFTTLVTGTSGSHQRVKPEYLLEIDVIIPPPVLVEKFTDILRPLYQKILENLSESNVLTQIRDSLLPRLMSGKIRVN